jgi:hypothetical protein
MVESADVSASQGSFLSGLARQLVDDARARGITLRLIGSIAVRERCADRQDIFRQLDRESPIDIDLVGYSKQQSQIGQMFAALAYRIDPTIAQSQEWGIKRLIYYGPEGNVKVDIFLDVLRMSHTIDFKDRLELTPLTVSPADLLLAKLQVFRITEKDLKDIVVLLLIHELGGASPNEIDVRYVLRRLRRDWGLYFTASKNLALVDAWLNAHQGLREEDAGLVRARLLQLRRQIETEPKTVRWRLRAAIGPRLQWYEEVGDVDR